MPFWTPAEPYVELIRRDPAPLRIALSHEWGDYRATPHFVAELERAGRLLEGLGHHVEWALPAVDFRAAFAAQTTCYISNFAQTIANLLEPLGLERPPEDRVEPINIRSGRPGGTPPMPSGRGCRRCSTPPRAPSARFFEDWDIILTPITALPTPPIGTTEYLTISDNPSVHDWFGQSLAQLRLHAAGQSVRHPGDLAAAGDAGERRADRHPGAGASRPNDGLLLQLAAQIERAIGGRWNDGRRPGVHVAAG